MALTGLTLVVFVLGFFVALLDNGLRARVGVAARQVAAFGLAVVAVAGLVAALVAIGNPVDLRRRQVGGVHERRESGSPPGRPGSARSAASAMTSGGSHGWSSSRSR